MALADITLVDSQAAPQNHVMVYVVTENGQVVRKNLSAGLETPELYVLGSRDAKVGGVMVRSSLRKLTLGFLDADGVTTRYMSIREIVDVDPKIYTDARIEDLVTMFRSDGTEARMLLYTKGSVG